MTRFLAALAACSITAAACGAASPPRSAAAQRFDEHAEPRAAQEPPPCQEEREEALSKPSGSVYRIAGDFGDKPAPTEAVIGAWQVDDEGKIVGAFVRNPSYDAKRWPKIWRCRTIP